LANLGHATGYDKVSFKVTLKEDPPDGTDDDLKKKLGLIRTANHLFPMDEHNKLKEFDSVQTSK
jgi:hypothetical protein